MSKKGFFRAIALTAAIAWSGGLLATAFAAGPRGGQHIPGELVVECREGVVAGPGSGTLKAYPSHRTAADIASSGRPASLTALDRRFCLREGRPLFTVKRSWAEAAGRTARREIGAPSLSSNTWLLRFDPGVDLAEARKAYENDPNVVYAELNYIGSLSYAPGNDPLYAQTQANLALIGMEAAWDAQQGADSSIVVAVIDSGVDRNHPELSGAIHPASHNFTNVLTPNSIFDDNGHGTRVAGIIAATEDNGEGIAGIAFGCRIMSLDVATSSGQTSSSDASEAINWAVAEGADVINMSFGFSARSTLMENACAAADAANVLLVAAAGNANQGSFPQYPASFDTVIGVGAVMDLLGALIRAPWSNYNGDETSLVELVAPGEKIFSTIPASQYDGLYGSGTSFAAPMVSGVAALLKAKSPSQSSRAIRAHLGATADPQGDWAGRGLIDAAAALSADIPPDLQIVGCEIDDATTRSIGVNNGDGRLQAGETAVLRVRLENRWGDAANVTAALSNPDSQVTVTDSTASWNDIRSHAVGVTQDDSMEVQIDASAGAGVTTFSLAISSDTASYSRTGAFAVPIESLLFLTTSTIGLDTTWTSDNTYVVQGKITVAPGATLTIDPGTTVRFTPSGSLEVLNGGGIRAEGAARREITFSSALAEMSLPPPDGKPAYAGITVTSQTATSIFSHCIFEYGPVRDESTVSTIADCLFDHTGGQYSLYAPKGANPIVRCTAQFNRDPTYAYGNGIGAGSSKGLTNCAATGNLGLFGLMGGVLEECLAQENDGHGMACFSVARFCRAVRNAGRGIISLGDVEECFASGNGHRLSGTPGWGIYALDTVRSSTAIGNYHGVHGGGVQDTTASGNGPEGAPAGISSDSVAIEARVTTRCLAVDNSGIGIRLTTATLTDNVAVDCYIVRNGQGLVLTDAATHSGTAIRCRISENVGDGVTSGSVQSCVVDHNTEDGLSAPRVALNSWVVENGGTGIFQPREHVGDCVIERNWGEGVLAPRSPIITCTVSRNGGVGVAAGGKPSWGSDVQSAYIQHSSVFGNRGWGVYSVDIQDSNLFANQGKVNGQGDQRFDYVEGRPPTEIASATRIYWGEDTITSMNLLLGKGARWGPSTAGGSDYMNVPAIFDFKDDGRVAQVDYWNLSGGPWLASWSVPLPNNEPPPFLHMVTPNLDQAISAGPTTFTLVFSQPMDTSEQPSVTFGSAAPYIQHVVRVHPKWVAANGWADSTTWHGAFVVRDDTGDGRQHVRVARVQAAGGRPMPADSGNEFDIDLEGGLCANNGLASALTGTNMYLEWDQNGKPAGAQGYNARRSTTGIPGTYSKVNSSPITGPSGGSVSYNDLGVGPGTAYFYVVDLVDGGGNSTQWTPPFVGITPGDPWTPTPEVTATPTPTLTPATTPSPTPERTATPAFSSTPTPTPRATHTPTPDVTATPTVSPIRALIISFYNIILARDPEPGAVEAWEIGYFEYAVSFNIDVRFIPREMARLFFLSEEYANRSRANAEFITDCYQVFLGRAPSQTELDNWLGGVWNRAQVMTVFSESEEFANRIQAMYPQYGGNSTRNFVTTMYVGLLDRLVDSAGLEYAAGLFDVARLQGGIEAVRAQAKQMGREVIVSPEFLSKGPTNEDRVVRLYRAFLGRFPNDSEIAYWAGLLDAGALTPNDLIDLFAEATEFTNRLDEFF